MPHISAKLSISLDGEKENHLKTELGKAISCLSGKSEDWLMVTIEDNCHMYFKGENNNPCAFLEVQVLGKINPDDSRRMSSVLCDVLSDFNIPQNRVYIKYEEVEQWGWNGGNF